MNRRLLVRLLAGASVSSLTGPTWAQEPALKMVYPSKPIRFVIGNAPGTVPDTVARQVADGLSAEFRQPVVVENRVSAGGIVALEALKSSAPDGYVLSVVPMPAMSVSPSMFKQLPYDPLTDFTHVGILYRGPQFLVVNPSVSATTLREFVALATSRPGRLRYGSLGMGSPNHVLMEYFKYQAKIDVQHIPYKGPAAYTAVLAGEVDALIEGVGPMLPYVRDGKLRALAVTGSRRVDSMPGIPTFEELGFKDIDAVWVGVIGPKGLPPAIVATLNRALAKTMRSPEIRMTFEAVGRIVEPGSPQEMTATIAAEIPRWREVVRRAGISPE